jgi:hypothetical protein
MQRPLPLHPARSGLTRIDLIVLLGIAIVLAAILLPAFRRGRTNSMHLASSSQLNGMMRCFLNWSSDNRQLFPLPSRIDVNNTTVPELGGAKDTTSNILSVLMWNQYLSPAYMRIPPRNAPWFEPYTDSGGAGATMAVDPAHALWDPSFSADFSAGKKANIGIAHVRPRDEAGHVSALWRSTQSASRPILSERGAEITGTRTTPGQRTQPLYANPDARMLRPFGRDRSWEGSIAFGDGHVEFHLEPSASAIKPGGTNPLPDWLFHDDPALPDGADDFLGIFRRAGDRAADFEAIWD